MLVSRTIARVVLISTLIILCSLNLTSFIQGLPFQSSNGIQSKINGRNNVNNDLSVSREQMHHEPLIFNSNHTIEPMAMSKKGSDKNLEKEEEWAPVWVRLILVGVLVLVGGLMAGLTIGLMSIDETNLKIMARSGNATEAGYAQKIWPLRRRGHLLLCTLLIANTVINETLPIVTDSISGLNGWQAILISSALIVVFGEIIPQAVCSRYGLRIGANLAWLVHLLTWLLYIVAYPISKLLDLILGEHHGTLYRRTELKELVSLLGDQTIGNLTADEVTIIKGVLDLRDKIASSVMTPLEDVFMLDYNSKLTPQIVQTLVENGYSRVPVYKDRRERIVGMILTKKLVTFLLNYEDQQLQAAKVEKEVEKNDTNNAEINITEIDNIETNNTEPNNIEIHNTEVNASESKKPNVENSPKKKKGTGEASFLSFKATGIPIKKLPLNSLPTVPSNTPLFDMINEFQKGQSHMAVVVQHIERSTNAFNNTPSPSPPLIDLAASNSSNHNAINNINGSSNTINNSSSNLINIPKHINNSPYKKAIGVITLEDVIEELIQEEIIDETDLYVDIHAKIKVNRTAANNINPVSNNSIGRFLLPEAFNSITSLWSVNKAGVPVPINNNSNNFDDNSPNNSTHNLEPPPININNNCSHHNFDDQNNNNENNNENIFDYSESPSSPSKYNLMPEGFGRSSRLSPQKQQQLRNDANNNISMLPFQKGTFSKLDTRPISLMALKKERKLALSGTTSTIVHLNPKENNNNDENNNETTTAKDTINQTATSSSSSLGEIKPLLK